MLPTRLLGAAVLIAASLLPVSAASASQISSDGSTVTYTAGPGEQNSVLVSVTPYDLQCGSVGAPCLSVFDSGAWITGTSGPCEVSSNDPIAGATAVCALPAAVVANLGDRDDAYWDWNGPSTINGGSGNDNPVQGAGGDDVLHGESGNDVLFGEDGNDVVDGGLGDDDLDGIPGGTLDENVTHGSDTYIGGGGGDTVTYERRTEDLSLSPDGVANDGAAGEHDDIGRDVTTIIGGDAADTMKGTEGRNIFGGAGGDDELIGAGGDDQLAGGTGRDRLSGGDGTDVLGGDDGDDSLVGGPGIDRMYGDDVGACLAYSCTSGQDTIDAKDGNAELIDCGAGTDTVEGDSFDRVYDSVDLANQCENVHGIASGGAATAGVFEVTSAKVDRRRRIVVRMIAPGPGVAIVRATARGRLKVGRVRRSVQAAGPVTLKLKPSRAARRALHRRHRLKVSLRVAFKPTGGAKRTDKLTLRMRG